MQLLFLCKQKYMHKDAIRDRYGRLHELPFQLSRHHRITAIALNYRMTLAFRRPQSFMENDGKLTWYSLQLHFLLLPTLISYWQLVVRAFRQNAPVAVIGASDSLHIILASLLARMHGVRVLLDLYDNFEAFGLSKIPGIRMLYRRALRRADAVACVSNRLREHIEACCNNSGCVFTIESTVNKSEFYPLEKTAARRSLNLDTDGIYIGTAGALRASRGINTVYGAFREILKIRSDVKLLLAGEVDPRSPPPRHNNVVYLGDLAHADMNNFYNSLDIAFNYMRDDEFGRYSFPQKAYEILACSIPILTARVGVFPDLLKQDRFLYTPGDPEELKEKILALLDEPAVPEVDVPTWEQQAQKMDSIIRGLFPRKEA